jgi:predicted enzyme related to lactoylglutathione lyase
MTTVLKLRSVLTLLVPALVLWAQGAPGAPGTPGAQDSAAPQTKEKAMLVQYLEVVTADVDATCAALAELHGVRFGAPEPALGNARTAPMDGGGKIGVRAPMRADEVPVVRPYLLVEDIESAVEAAQAAGGEGALPPTEMPGRGQFAIYVLGGIQLGLWQR